MDIIIMRGLPGSGKTTWSKEHAASAIRCSADDYFTDSDGNYNFDPRQLSEAHAQCLRNYTALLTGHNTGRPVRSSELLVVDNTNISLTEMAPYVALGQAFGHNVRILEMRTPVEACLINNTHKVPNRVIYEMLATSQAQSLLCPKYWPKIELIKR